MDTLFSRLTDNENNALLHIREFSADDALSSGFNNNSQLCSNEYFLRYWDSAKRSNVWMMQMFADNLILSKKIKFKESKAELDSKAYEVIDSHEYSVVRDYVIDLVRHLNPDWDHDIWKDETLENPGLYWASHESIHNFSIQDALYFYLFDMKAIITNTYEGPDCEFFISDEKKFKLRKGMKFARVLTKLGNAVMAYWPNRLRDETLEEVRLRCSRVRNTAEIDANLCLSIHPLDFLTASWNECGWRSCMDFEDGEYRRGVIEMMNSPFVIVAYTTSSSDMNLYNGDVWNNKKWREFFIVHPRYGVFGIKGYPYWNQSLEEKTLEWVKELLTSENVSFSDPYAYQYNAGDRPIIETPNAAINKIVFNCGPAMYNDFYGSNQYTCILRDGVNTEEGYVRINYSGESICIICGEQSEFENESSVVCYNCCEIHTCSKCGDTIYSPDSLYRVHDFEFCECCFNELPTCEVCEDVCLPADWEEYDSAVEFGIGYSSKEGEFVTEGGRYPMVFCACNRCAHKLIRVNTDETLDNLLGNSPTYNNFWSYTPLVHPSRINMAEAKRSILSDEFYQELFNKMENNVLEHYQRNLESSFGFKQPVAVSF